MAGVLTIYGDKRSGNCLKGKWVADLLGVANDWVDIDIFKGESRAQDFLAKNPAGQVPVAFGVLTTDTIEQAIERAGTKAGNKGWEAAMSAIEMAGLYRQLRG